MISLIALLIPLVIQIFQQYFSAKAKLSAINKKFEVDTTSFLLLVRGAMDEMKSQAKKDTNNASKTDDIVDNDLRKK